MKLIAEVSMNHMGDMELAKKMIIAAADNGADFVKFQTWRVANLKPGPWDEDGRRQMYEKAELSDDDHRFLAKVCSDNQVSFLSSCFNPDDLELIRSVTNTVKIPSTECTNDELVGRAIEMFDEVFISTGTATESEYMRYIDSKKVYLLHCVSCYPCPAEKVNLRRLQHLSLNTPRFGYSGHYFGIWDAIAAIGFGARVVEKHFTIDRDLPFRDNKFAILPAELRQIRQFADEYQKMKTDHGLDYQESESEVRENYCRRWCK
jgi:sialic acid synthase SpsE